jgi:hypothetical protein
MEFRNLTPLYAMAFSAVDVRGNEFHVAVMRVGYRLVRRSTFDSNNGLTHDCVLLEGDAALPIAMSDEYEGEEGRSSVKVESDLAPFKPKCDVLVRATSYAPGAQAAMSWPARLRVLDGETVVVDKALRVCGPRSFHKGWRGWRLGEPEPATHVPLRWEYAFGGSSLVAASAGSEQSDADASPLLNEVCFTNPLGAGWLEKRYLSLSSRPDVEHTSDVLKLPSTERRVREIRACQIEAWNAPVTTLDIADHKATNLDATQMTEVATRYGAIPVGLGPVGRAWSPRLARAGTYDASWLEHGWPYLPKDFDFRYWNGAPDDQKIAWPSSGFSFELANLARPEDSTSGFLRARMPGHRAITALRFETGAVAPIETRLDTVLIDTEEMTVSLTWRAVFPANPAVRVCEARFETDPTAPALRFDMSRSSDQKEESWPVT